MERCTVATHRFKKDLKSCSTKNILKTLQEFITFRLRANPIENFGKKDSMFSNGKYRGFRHFHLVHGRLILIYQITANQLRLCAIAVHKEFNPNSAFADWIDGLRGEDYQMF